jgi:crotonobetainyl-CoA:carnitine CoA-transferase CaiB-like acyl-CoA transferase
MGMALEGVRVIDFSQMMMGPWCTQFLGDLGAEVIKIERPGTGDWERGLPAMGQLLAGDSPFFLAMNRNKKSVTLNLKDPRAKEVVFRLVETAHLVVENFRPGVMDRLGLGYDDLRKVNPGIVYVSGSGYGSSGPYVSRPGQDLLIQALSGIAANTGRRDDPPTPAGTSIVDASTALLMAFAAMVGLFHRFRTGQGQKIEVSLLNTAIAIQCQELAAFLNLPKRWERSASGIGGAWLAAPFGIYQTQDGYLAIAMASLTTLGQLLDLPELAQYDTPELAYEQRDVIKPMIESRLAANTTTYWLELLLAHDVWCAEVKSFDEVVTDPQVLHNHLLETMVHPRAGELRVVGNPIVFSETPAAIRYPPPLLGQHTEEVLRELGYSAEEIVRLREEGVI